MLPSETGGSSCPAECTLGVALTLLSTSTLYYALGLFWHMLAVMHQGKIIQQQCKIFFKVTNIVPVMRPF